MKRFILAILLISTHAFLQAQPIRTPSPAMLQAAKYLNTTVVPILGKYIQESTETPALRNRLRRLEELNARKQLEIRPNLGISMIGTKTVSLGSNFDPAQNKYTLYIYVRVIQGLQAKLPLADFERRVALSFAHEVIHYEQWGSATPASLSRILIDGSQENRQDEARAWGTTVVELIRPMIRQKRLNDPTLMRYSQVLASVKDNFNDPLWISTVN